MAKRIGSIDILKALGICSVILYHTTTLPTGINVWIGSYFMPLFFFASGLTFSEKQPKFSLFLKKKCVYLLLPYFLYLLCCTALSIVKQIMGAEVFQPGKFVLAILSGLPNMNDYTGRAWFIYCFFVAELIFYFLLKWTEGKRKQLFLIALVCLLAGYFYTRYLRESAPMFWRCADALVAVFFMTMGFLLRDWALRLNATGLLFLLPSAGFAALNYAINGHGLVMAYSYYGELLPMVASAVCGCLFFLALSNCINCRYLEYIGRNTLFIYLFHFFLWSYPLPRLLSRVLPTGTPLYNGLYTVLLFAEVLVVFSLLIPVYNKIVRPIQQRFIQKKNKD